MGLTLNKYLILVKKSYDPWCQDLCLNLPGCIGVVVEKVDYPVSPVKCYLKHEFERCEQADGYTAASIMYYNCGDNHDCAGSFVRVSARFLGSFC